MFHRRLLEFLKFSPLVVLACVAVFAVLPFSALSKVAVTLLGLGIAVICFSVERFLLKGYPFEGAP